MTAPWLDDGDVAFYHGDALTVLRSLPAGVAQTCVTSPPYWGLRDYGTGTWTGGDPGCDHTGLPKASTKSTLKNDGRPAERVGQNEYEREARVPYAAECGRCGARRVDDQLGLEATPDAYVTRLVLVMREVWRVLRADGTLWLNLGDSYAAGGDRALGRLDQDRPIARHDGRAPAPAGRKTERSSFAVDHGLKQKDLVGVPWRVAFALQADGWYLRSDIIWSKPNPMPESVTDRPTKAHEYVFLLAKQPRYYYDADAIREPAEYGRREWSDAEAVMAAATTGNDKRPNHGVRVKASVTGGDPSAGRNCRSVWEVATQPTPEAHFATYPEALVRRCILAGTSAHGGCAMCGAPWQRQVEVDGETPRDIKNRVGESAFSSGGHQPGNTRQGISHAGGHGDGLRDRTTTGWAASCSCGAPPPVPQLVLDPFVGSGTTALVARKHGRRAIGVDLSAEYLEIAARRTAQLSLLGEGAA